MLDESLLILNMTWLSSSSTLAGSLGNRMASRTAYAVVPVLLDSPTSTGILAAVMEAGTKVRKYGSPQPITNVRPAAVDGYGFSTVASAFSSRRWASLRALSVQLRPAAS